MLDGVRAVLITGQKKFPVAESILLTAMLPTIPPVELARQKHLLSPRSPFSVGDTILVYEEAIFLISTFIKKEVYPLANSIRLPSVW
jgi:hypothetical protein